MRFSLMSYEMPEVSGPKYGCFSKIPRHPPEIKKGLFKSTYMDDFLSRFEKVKYKPTTCEVLTSTGVNSGLRSDYEPIDKKHISSKLVNERYNKDPDSKYNTEVQRSWTYHRDPAIIAVEDLKIDNASRKPWPEEIKFMSLPMHNEEEYQKMQYHTYVNCGHKLSDITKKKLKEMAEAKKAKEEALKEF